MTDAAGARGYLEGSGVYAHLVSTLLTILDEKPSSPLDAFESVSSSTKAGDVLVASKPVDELTLVRAKEVTEMISPTIPEMPEGEEYAPPATNEAVEDVRDLMRDADLLEKAGVGLGKAETYRVALAMKQLADDEAHGVKTVRFFGKIFGSGGDYLICEAIPAEYGEAAELTEEEVAAGVIPADAPGVGCNKFVYFVCSRPGSSWTKLPNVLPAQIMGARSIKKLFTGELTTPIEGFPVFPGNEGDYLRAQIARIAANTGVVPAGVYTGPWDEEEYEAPEVGSGEAYADPEVSTALCQYYTTSPNCTAL
jgi:radial spoke head protein 4A